ARARQRPSDPEAGRIDECRTIHTYAGTPARSSRNPQYTTSAPAPLIAQNEYANARHAIAVAPRATGDDPRRRRCSVRRPASEQNAYGTSALSVPSRMTNVNKS